MSKTRRNIPFKDYSPRQGMLLPPSLDELIPEDHPVRVVDRILDDVDISFLISSYRGGGTSSYHPKMMLKVIIYSYLRNIYSSRKIEEALKESIHFMWLSGMSYPDHNTINRFRGERLENSLKDIFSQVVLLLADEGHVSLKKAYIDGTKIEANASRYSFVWGRSIATSRERIKKQLDELWQYVQQVYESELTEPDKPDFTEISPEKVEKAIDQINQALKDRAISEDVKKN